jgi:hypothetical protein
MIKNEQLIQALCLPYCIYYKPGKNEESVCRGAVVVEQLVSAGKQITVVRPAEQRTTVPDESLVIRLCSACDFREHDCDFMQDRATTPCGGFILLEQLLGSGVLSLEDIR